MDAKAQIKQFILEEIVAEAGLSISDFGDEESLIDSGVLDSLGMLKLIAFLDEEMDTNIMAEDFSLEDFATLNLICGWVEGHGGAASNVEPAPSGADAARDVPEPAPAAASGDAATAGTAEPTAPAGGSATAALTETTPMPTIADLKAAAVDPGLKDRVVLITGASRGIGETLAKLFSIYGSRVVINYTSSEGHAQRVADEITAAGGAAMVARADVSDRGQVDDMIRRIGDRWGTVDILVNNAAADAVPVEFAKLDWSEVARGIDIVARGAFNCCQAVIPDMVRRGGGKIVSIGTLATDNPAPNQLKYVMAKSALVGLTRSLAVDYAEQNIQINMVAPSVVETDLISHIPDGFRSRIAQATPMRRNATPTDVAQTVLYLASAHCQFTTGQKIMVTGGATPFL